MECMINYPCKCSLDCAAYYGRKPRVRVKAETRSVANWVPDDAEPGDLVLGNRGAASEVEEVRTSGPLRLRCLITRYVGNYGMGKVINRNGKVYDFR